MTVIRVKGLNRVKGRKGEIYLYHRATGTRLKQEPGTPAFFAELAALNDLPPKKAGVPSPDAGTLGALIHAYKASPEFAGKADRTKADYLKVLDYLGKMGEMPLAEIDSGFVLDLRDQTFSLRRRRFANYAVQVLRLLLAWGVPRKWLPANPAEKTPLIGRPTAMARANRAWTDDEVKAVLEGATGALQIVIALGVFAALREGDAIRFAWSGYDGSALDWTQGKTGERVWIPAHKDLRTILDKVPRSSPVIAIGRRGTPYTESGFRASFFKLLGKLEAAAAIGAGLTFHGLRHTAGKRLAEAGCDTTTIAAMLGHATEKMAKHYSRDASQKRRVVVAMAALDRSDRNKRRVASAKHTDSVCKTPTKEPPK